MDRNFIYTIFLGGFVALAGCDTYHDMRPQYQKDAVKTNQTLQKQPISYKKQEGLDSILTKRQDIADSIPKQPQSDLNQSPYWISADYWINSRPLNKKDLEGKLVLLDFWATWCGPCVQYLPDIEKYHKENKDKGVIVIGVCPIKEELDLAVKNYHEIFIREHNITFPIVLDKDGKTLKKYGNKTIPAQILFDKDGKIFERK